MGFAPLLLAYALCLAAPPPVGAQFPPEPEGVTVVRSHYNDNITIRYKETNICETTPGVRSYAGYVNLPRGSLADVGDENEYPINTFFWFFESRKDPLHAPLNLFMNGGPGASSMLALLAENGPCFVNADSNSTRLNEWSWNNEVNMLYLDQPVQVGLSYDILQNVTKNLVTGEIALLRPDTPVPKQNATFLAGTFPSQNLTQTSRGTMRAAAAFWHFLQTWTQEFPHYHPRDSRVSISTESYGGRYGPAFATFLERQNQKIEVGVWSHLQRQPHFINLDTLLLINACVDRPIMWPHYPEMAYHNTFGLETVNKTIYDDMLETIYKPGGCLNLIEECRIVSLASDPDDLGINATVNAICATAENFCSKHLRANFASVTGRDPYDITTLEPEPFPAPFLQGYLNQPHIQAALGVPVNYTGSSSTVADAFLAIGDYVRPGWMTDLAWLLDRGVKITMMYGDKDYACNWMGGEAVSLAINASTTTPFRKAGYADILTNISYVGGMVRQHGNLSFSRVFNAGHMVPSYQPETAYRIFTRALGNVDIATGVVPTFSSDDGSTYISVGPGNIRGVKNDVPKQPLQYCYVLDPRARCTDDQIRTIEDGTAEIRSWLVVDRNSTRLFPDIVVGHEDDDGYAESSDDKQLLLGQH